MPPKTPVETWTHPADTRKNIPTAETQGFMREEEALPKPRLYPRNPDLDPQLVWRGKDEQDAAPLSVDTVPIYIQEKIHPKAIIDSLRSAAARGAEPQADLFADFNGIDDPEAKLEFYAHDQHWSNRMILGDGLLVMNSLAEKEALKSRVQMIYLDPPYGIKFNSNYQASTRSTDVADGKLDSMSREPEVVKAFRDTWMDGVNTYLSYLRDRLKVSSELLSASGSVFVQIGDENVHLIGSVLDEVFGRENRVALISVAKTSSQTEEYLASVNDFIWWYAKDRSALKYRALFVSKKGAGDAGSEYNRIELSDLNRRSLTSEERKSPGFIPEDVRVYRQDNIISQSVGRQKGEGAASWFPVYFEGTEYRPNLQSRWKTNEDGFRRLIAARRIEPRGSMLSYVRFFDDFPVMPITNNWIDVKLSSRSEEKVYVVQSAMRMVERCMLMCTDPGDLVLDPTCGSGTTAYAAEQWGRRWITIDTSRVALALARQRLMSGRFPFYLLADSKDGAMKEAELAGRPPKDSSFRGDLRHGFIYERVPHIMLRDIAHNAEIDLIWEEMQPGIDNLRAELNTALGKSWEEWEVPRAADAGWPAAAKALHTNWWAMRRERQARIDASIARNADVEYLYDRPYEGKGVVRVTGPFTVESLSPHRVLSADEEDEAVLDALDQDMIARGETPPPRRRLRPGQADTAGDDFLTVVIENLASSGVQNTKKGEKLVFTSLKPWAGGRYIHAEGRYMEGDTERRAAITVGPEYGTVSRQLVMDAAREARDLFDVLVVCGFAFDPHVGNDTMSLGRLTVLKARMNQDLHMADHLKKTGAGNLFVVFGEPDVELRPSIAEPDKWEVEIKGVDIFDPTTGEVRSSGRVEDDVACWFVDTDYDGDSFFVRHAYFLNGRTRDPYEALKRTLKGEIDEAAWATLYNTTSRPFPKPKTGRVAVKVINHYGDEVMRVFGVE
jgi:adenine-specific DNA-methyltransferase